MQKTILILFFLLLVVSFSAAEESKRLYAGLRLGGSVGMTYPLDYRHNKYFGDDKTPYYKWRDGGSFDIAPFISLQITDKFAVQTEAMLTKFGYNGHTLSSIPDELDRRLLDYCYRKVRINRPALVFPFLAKRTLNRNNFSYQYYIGPHFTVNIGKWTSSHIFTNGSNDTELVYKYLYDAYNYDIPPVGLTAGLNLGFITKKDEKLFLDARILGDLGNIKSDGEPILYRAKLSFSLGYEFGFIER